MSNRVRRNPRLPGCCPRCGKMRWASWPRLWPWTVLHCSPCDVSWWYGWLSLDRNARAASGKRSRR